MQAAVCANFDGSPYGCGYWLCVAGRESSLIPENDENWPYVGLFQVDVEYHAELIASMGYTVADMYRAEPNITVAWSLSHDGVNTAPWPLTRWWC